MQEQENLKLTFSARFPTTVHPIFTPSIPPRNPRCANALSTITPHNDGRGGRMERDWVGKRRGIGKDKE